MKRLALGAALAALSAAAQAAPVTYSIDNSHTYPHFSYNHLGF
ncbi:MAG: polyisoprenoid-binding protein, partial [Thiobacillus sp.]|nr:polyisoprenoid-binding protein [Thiobacillus sp.]